MKTIPSGPYAILQRMAASEEKAAALELIAAPAIERRILVVRERQVMLDEDLAELYGVETKRLTQQVNGT